MNLKKIIKEEMDDFEWTKDIRSGLDGIRFHHFSNITPIYTIEDNGDDRVIVKWISVTGIHERVTYRREEAEKWLHNGQWVTV